MKNLIVISQGSYKLDFISQEEKNWYEDILIYDL